jgi:Family of unknown function (DUF6186)
MASTIADSMWLRALILPPADREHKTLFGGDGMRAIAVVGWLGIVAALLVWQGIGLVHGPEWPTLSDFFRSFMTVPLGRFILFGLWLWLGWHLFIRGWAFFLRS